MWTLHVLFSTFSTLPHTLSLTVSLHALRNVFGSFHLAIISASRSFTLHPYHRRLDLKPTRSLCRVESFNHFVLLIVQSGTCGYDPSSLSNHHQHSALLVASLSYKSCTRVWKRTGDIQSTTFSRLQIHEEARRDHLATTFRSPSEESSATCIKHVFGQHDERGESSYFDGGGGE